MKIAIWALYLNFIFQIKKIFSILLYTPPHTQIYIYIYIWVCMCMCMCWYMLIKSKTYAQKAFLSYEYINNDRAIINISIRQMSKQFARGIYTLSLVELSSTLLTKGLLSVNFLASLPHELNRDFNKTWLEWEDPIFYTYPEKVVRRSEITCWVFFVMERITGVLNEKDYTWIIKNSNNDFTFCTILILETYSL